MYTGAVTLNTEENYFCQKKPRKYNYVPHKKDVAIINIDVVCNCH